MSCVNPQPWLIPPKGSGQRPIHLQSDYSKNLVNLFGRLVYLPCGHCLECQIAKRKDLTALQCLEASLSRFNWFLTLTYDDEHLPDDGNLVRSHLSAFCESMRKHFKYFSTKFRYLAVGEYGAKSERPHYHLSVFDAPPSLFGISEGFDSADLVKDLNRGKLHRVRRSNYDSNGNFFWQSPVISARWPYGSHKMYVANEQTFQYVAGYVTKKLGSSSEHDVKEFRQTCRPSVGFPWYRKYGSRICNVNDLRLFNDSIFYGSHEWRVPRIMMKWIAKDRGDDFVSLVSRIRSSEFDMPDREHLDLVRRSGELSNLRYKQNHKKGDKL